MKVGGGLAAPTLTDRTLNGKALDEPTNTGDDGSPPTGST